MAKDSDADCPQNVIDFDEYRRGSRALACSYEITRDDFLFSGVMGLLEFITLEYERVCAEHDIDAWTEVIKEAKALVKQEKKRLNVE